MEDKAFVSILYPGVCLCAVLDGHGGNKAVEFFTKVIPQSLREALLKIISPTREQVKETVEKVFLDGDEQWYDQDIDTSGTTFTGVLIFSGDKKAVYLINLGDSRTVLCSDGKTIPSQDHKPSNLAEEKRIREAGGHVSWGRVDGMLAVSRALGDTDFKGSKKYEGREAKVSPVPDVTEYPFSENTKIVMASDGFFDAVYNDNDMILRYLEFEDPCNDLMEYAHWKSSDNIMIMMLDLSSQRE